VGCHSGHGEFGRTLHLFFGLSEGDRRFFMRHLTVSACGKDGDSVIL
jgi:hypothetical protein